MEACRLFNRLVYFLVEKSLGNPKDIDPYVFLKIAATWGGRLCLVVFLCAVTVVTWVILFVIIPFEYSVSTNPVLFGAKIVLFAFTFYNIMFHYYKARTLAPVKNAGVPHRDRFCLKCNTWKSPSTSHCKACDACIYRMDHHCPHIGQCVGAHNQANFYLFLFYLLVGTALFFLLAQSFWWKFYETRKMLMNIPEDQCWRLFCVNRFYNLFFSSYGYHDQAVKFSCFLFLLLHWIMWGFVGGYTYIISIGLTMAMRMFQKSDAESRKPFTWAVVKNRWRTYFNCRDESLWTVFLIPRTRPIVVYHDYKEMII